MVWLAHWAIPSNICNSSTSMLISTRRLTIGFRWDVLICICDRFLEECRRLAAVAFIWLRNYSDCGFELVWSTWILTLFLLHLFNDLLVDVRFFFKVERFDEVRALRLSFLLDLACSTFRLRIGAGARLLLFGLNADMAFLICFFWCLPIFKLTELICLFSRKIGCSSTIEQNVIYWNIERTHSQIISFEYNKQQKVIC